MFQRIWVNYVTTAANTSEQTFTFANPVDDYRVRHLKAIYVGIATAGVTFGFYSESQKLLTVDCTRFAAGNQPLMIDRDIPARIQPVVSLTNLAGAALTNVPIMLLYEVDN